jgi:predicted Zn-dependent protease with MMP-like domain
MAVIDLISDKAKLVAFKCERKFAMKIFDGQNSRVNTNWNRLQELALEEIEATLAELPLPLREQAQKLPVTFERAPNAGLKSDGIAPDTLGIFTGAEFADEGATVLPSQIILFIGNLWDFSENDENIFCEEIRKTFLHELGHFFGLNENDLTERGLE